MSDGHEGAREITDDDFEASAGQGWALVDFYASWCPHCKAFRVIYDSFARDYKGSVALVAADVDLAKQATARFKIRAVPALLLLKDGEKIGQRAGNMKQDELEQWLDEAISAE